jgi:hypothetical protein
MDRGVIYANRLTSIQSIKLAAPEDLSLVVDRDFFVDLPD